MSARSFEILPFARAHQAGVRSVAWDVLCREYHRQADLTGEDDLEEVGAVYRAPDNRFLVAVMNGEVIGTAGIFRLSDEDCELRRLYVLREHRRQGVASNLVGNLLEFVRERGYRRILLEVLPEMEDKVPVYARYGFGPLAADEPVPRAAKFLAIRL